MVILVLTGDIAVNMIDHMATCCFVVSFIHCILGTLSSAATSILLYRISARQLEEKLMKEKRRSAVSILLMNVPHLVTSVFVLLFLVHDGDVAWFDIGFVFCPILTATINPIVIVSRNPAIRRSVSSNVMTSKILHSVGHKKEKSSTYNDSYVTPL